MILIIIAAIVAGFFGYVIGNGVNHSRRMNEWRATCIGLALLANDANAAEAPKVCPSNPVEMVCFIGGDAAPCPCACGGAGGGATNQQGTGGGASLPFLPLVTATPTPTQSLTYGTTTESVGQAVSPSQ
jgi:hypothetical protein